MLLQINNPIVSSNSRLENLVEAFIASLDIAPSSQNTYRRSIRPLWCYFSSQGIHRPTPQDILNFKRHLEGQGLSPSTIASYLTAAKALFKWLESQKLYENIAKDIKLPRPSRGFKKDPLTIEQIQKLLSSLNTSYPEGLRNYAILNLLIRTGLRTISVVSANVGDIKEVSGQKVLYVRIKGSLEKDNFVLLTSSTLEPLQNYLQTRKNISSEDPLFTSLSDRCLSQRLSTRTVSLIVKEALRRIGIDDSRITAHSMRHTAITLALKNGASIQDVQSMSHHSDMNVLLHYAHNLDRIQNSAEKRIDDLLSHNSPDKKI